MLCLSKFIRENKGAILDMWARETDAVIPRALNHAAMRPEVEEMLECVADYIAPYHHTSAGCLEMARRFTEHRYAAGLEVQEILHEQCVLREGIIRLWLAAHKGRRTAIPNGLLEFERAMNESLREIICGHNERINRARALFLGALVHDLKNPVQAIQQSMQLLPLLGPLNDKQAQLLAQITSSAGSVADLSSKLIDSVRIRLGKGIEIDPRPVNLGEAARQPVEEVRAGHPEKLINFRAEGDLEGCWDALRMKEIVSNLVSNAVQYGKPDAPVDVWLTSEGKDVVLSVHNEGNPIPPREIGNIFDPLTRGSDQEGSRRKSSMGLGLFIAREVAQAHGGDLTVSSTADDGTTFTLRVPKRFDCYVEQKLGAGA